MEPRPTSEPTEYGYYGWKEFRRNRADILAEYYRSKDYNASRPVQTEHGVAGEAAFRNWLSDFLPKRFGVTSGYIIPDLVVADYRLRHFDLIIYDSLSSPVLWIDGDFDKSDQGKKRAIPARNVCAVLEIKAGLTRRSAEEGIKKLGELNAFVGHLPSVFSSGLVFFELDVKEANSFDIVQALLPSAPIMGYWGGSVLRCALDLEMSAIFQIHALPSNKEEAKNVAIPIAKDLGKIGVSANSSGNPVITEQGAGVMAFSDGKAWHFSKMYGPIAYNDIMGLHFNWSHNGFATFALDLLTRLEGLPLNAERKYVFGQTFDVIR